MTTSYKTREKIIKENWGSLTGKTIKLVRPLLDDEYDEMMWDTYGDNEIALVIQFTDGSYIVPMADPEGNGAGFLMYEEAQS